jgi:hypothetical protein
MINAAESLLASVLRGDRASLEGLENPMVLEEIARALLIRFPGHFDSEKKALTRVADLSEKYAATCPSS